MNKKTLISLVSLFSIVLLLGAGCGNNPELDKSFLNGHLNIQDYCSQMIENTYFPSMLFYEKCTKYHVVNGKKCKWVKATTVINEKDWLFNCIEIPKSKKDNALKIKSLKDQIKILENENE